MSNLLLFLSPCPNDTFMLDAWLNKQADTFDLPVKFSFYDIKTLNELSANCIADITKLSVLTAANVLNNYQILTSGAAIGYENGPLVVSKKKIYPDEIPYLKIAVPGINTTAFALLKIFYNKLYSIKEYFFYEIEDVILDNEADAGLIIHESRFTYQQKGLKLVIDLGKLWHQKFNLPLPLGIFAVKRTLDINTKLKINELIKESILFAFKNPHISYKFVIENAQVKDTQVITNHISLYVNDYSVNMGEIGKKSIYTFFEEANKIDLINNNFKTQSVFVS